jgi:hypothetical protein
MKFKNQIYFILVILLLISGVEAFAAVPSGKTNVNQDTKNSKDSIRIFNGKDLSNLKIILDNPGINTNDFYSVKDGVLYFPAGYKGYVRTKNVFSNFVLHAEWKWTEKKEEGNSGILVFILPPDTIWPNCLQVNFKENHAGDLIAMNGARFKEAEGKPKNTALMLSASSEKSEGEWNSCDLSCLDDSLVVYINGVLQNKATKIINHSGNIGWQLEGKPIALKNIFLIMKK